VEEREMLMHMMDLDNKHGGGTRHRTAQQPRVLV
jgi:hypothetical protein